MAINDVFPGPARPNKVPTYLDPNVRYALDKIAEEKGWPTTSAAVRELTLIALEELGWGTRRIRTEYLEFSLDCEKRGVTNPYEPVR